MNLSKIVLPAIALPAALPLSAFVLILGTWAVSAAEPQPHLVIVTAEASPIESLTQSQLRRLFLGAPIKYKGRAVKPLRNASDPLLYEMMLQKIVFMSSENYENYLLARARQAGFQHPELLSNQENVIELLRQRPSAVTFLWADVAVKTRGIKVIQEIW